MLSLKEYAAARNVSYEAVRKQVKRYKNELEGHVIQDNRTQYLDDEAVAFLDEKRNKNPIIVMEADKSAELDELREENRLLHLKVEQLQDALLAEKDAVKLLQTEKIALLEAAAAPDTRRKWRWPWEKGE